MTFNVLNTQISTGGALSSAAQWALEYALVKPTAKRSIGTLLPQVVIKERHTDELEMTDHPVEAGATITDHAFKLPAVVVIECGFGSAGKSAGLPLSLQQPVDLKAIYDSLRAYQDPPTLLTVVTGKRTYTDMLLKTLVVETDMETENVLRVTATLRQVIMATVQDVTVTAPASAMAEPQTTQSSTNTGTLQVTPTTVPVGTSGASS